MDGDLEGVPGIISIPLKEFVDFIDHSQVVSYEGTDTTPACDDSVTWLLNMTPFVITEVQLVELRSLQSEQVQKDGGNFRNIQKEEEGT